MYGCTLRMIPSFSKLALSMPPKRPREDGVDGGGGGGVPNEIYFKSNSKKYKQLSNLFGHVEWDFQMVKFKEGSAVWTFMRDRRDCTPEEFKQMFEKLKGTDKTEKSGSNYYIDRDSGEIATGIIPKFLSEIAKPAGKSVSLARKRLGYILGKEDVTVAELEAWRVENVKPELSNDEKDELMLKLLRVKFATPRYKELLLQTGDAILHEAKGRTAPNRYEWQRKPLTEKEIEKNYTRGGDVLGRLMMQVRSEISS